MTDESKQGDSGGSGSKKPPPPKRPDIQGWVEKGQKPGQTKDGQQQDEKRSD